MSFNFKKLSPWLDHLPFDWSIFQQYGTKMEVKKDQYIYHAEDDLDYIYIVLNGRVRLFLFTPEGKEKTVLIIGKNGLLGDHFLTSHHAHSTSAITVSDTKLLKVDKLTFEKVAFSDKNMIKQWLEMLSLKLEILANSSLNLSFDSSSQRIIRAFIQLAAMYGVENPDGTVKINMTFTHQELADLIGTSRITVSNEINKLQQQHVIEKIGRYYHIKNKKIMEEYTF